MQCATCNTVFEYSESEQKMLQKLGVTAPKQCIECRFQQLLSFWSSVGKWYKRKCDFSGETIITNYPKDARFPVYKAKYFNGDGWDSVTLDYDSSQPFLDQLKYLQEQNPRPHMIGLNNENCDYCDDCWSSKDCFLSMSLLECEKIYYGYRVINCSHCIDITYCYDSDNCYDLTHGFNCYKVRYSFSVYDSQDSLFLYDCRNCKDCFMCWNLRDKQYFIKNKQYTKEEYEKQINSYKLHLRSSIKKLKQEFQNHIQKDAYHPAYLHTNCETSRGNYLTNDQACTNCFFLEESKDMVNIIRGVKNQTSMNCTGVLESEKCYGISQVSYAYNLKYSAYCIHCHDSQYLDNCKNCSHCFGCIGLKDKEYCVLNKQYSKKEYEILVQKIIQDMERDCSYGSILPYNMMYTGYNTTLARFFFPKKKEEILALGGYWEDDMGIQVTGETYTLPDDIHEVSDDVHTKVIECAETGQLFNFLPQAIAFHKKYSIPLPDVTHLLRVGERFKPLSNVKSYQGVCSETGEKIVHYYPPEWGYEKIVSKEWYDKNIQ